MWIRFPIGLQIAPNTLTTLVIQCASGHISPILPVLSKQHHQSLERLQITRSETHLKDNAVPVSPLFSELLALEHLCLHTNSAYIIDPMDLPVGRLAEIEIDWEDCSSTMALKFIQERAPGGGGYLRSLRIHRCSDRSPSQNWPRLSVTVQQFGVTFSFDH